MQRFAAPLCHSKSIHYRINTDGISDEMLMPGEVRQNLFLIFKESINNTIKYAEATSCDTSFAIENGQFILKITDNGSGTSGNINGTGNGWKNMQKRAEDLNGHLRIESISGRGTTVAIALPYPFKIPTSWDKKTKLN
jgi:signal transduction histidine kinase